TLAVYASCRPLGRLRKTRFRLVVSLSGWDWLPTELLQEVSAFRLPLPLSFSCRYPLTPLTPVRQSSFAIRTSQFVIAFSFSPSPSATPATAPIRSKLPRRCSPPFPPLHLPTLFVPAFPPGPDHSAAASFAPSHSN